MNKNEAKIRIETLKRTINRHRYLYHVLDKPEISDAVLDSLKKELFDLERQYPEFITKDSPTQRIGGKPLEKFKKFTHLKPMLSFNDAFSMQDMENWEKRIRRIERKSDSRGYFCELKIDGLAVELIYKNGVLDVGATRGDGKIGEEVTQNIKTIEAVPLKIGFDENNRLKNLPAGSFPNILAVRGEVFISAKEFERINKEQRKAKGKTYANPRNLAAGSIRQLDPKIIASRKLDFYAYSIANDLGHETHEKEHKILERLGFKINKHNKLVRNLREVNEFRDKWEKDRKKLDYEIDGVVVIVNDNKIFNRLGTAGKAPRAAIAYKFYPKEATTIVEDITVSVGRTGILTPIALLKPVRIGGVTVSRATLHNEDEIARLGVKIGDTVVVGRAGDVIPDVKKVVKELRTGREKTFKMPSICPVCGGKVVRKPGEAAHKCVNLKCPAIRREGLYHFVSKSALDIAGLGPKTLDQLVDSGLIKDAADLFKLQKRDLLQLERFAEKSAQNTIDAIQSKRKIPLDRFIYALGIPHVGAETSFDLASNFGSLDKLSNASLAELEGVPDIGGVVAESIYGWFRNGYNLKLLSKFKKNGLSILSQKRLLKSDKLKGKTFVFTGSLNNFSREEAELLVRQHGGEPSSSVSKNTDYVVLGKEPGSKYDKAKKLGIKIIDEKAFRGIIKQ